MPTNYPDYSWDHEGMGNDVGFGVHILKNEVKAHVRKPSWWGTETVFRPFPCVSFQEPKTKFEPYRRVENGVWKFGDWIRRYSAAWGVGMESKTFLIPRPHPMYDPWSSPLGILYRAVENACKKGEAKDPSWYPLRESGMNKGKALRGPSEIYLMQGVLLRHDKTIYGGKNGPPPGWGKHPTLILMLSKDAGRTLVSLLNQEKEGYQGDPRDFEARYEFGDPVSTMTGRFFHFWERGTDPGNRYQSQPVKPATPGGSAFDDMEVDNAGGGGPNRQMETKGFEVEIGVNYNGRSACLNQLAEEQIRQHWQHWDDILYKPTEIEQAHLLADCFPATAIIYAFEPINKDWIPDKCWQSLKQPVSANFRMQPAAQAPGFSQNDLEGFGEPVQGPPAAPQPASAPQPAPAPAAAQDVSPWDDPSTGETDSTAPRVSQVPGPATAPVAEQPPAAPMSPPVQQPVGKERSDEAMAKLLKARKEQAKK